MNRAPIFDVIQRRTKIAKIFRPVLAKYGLEHLFDPLKLHIRKERITELSYCRELSNGILEAMFPKEPIPSDLFHYTKLPVLRSIASFGKLRLYWVRKRIGQGELDTFAVTHGLEGYLKSSKGKAPFYKELSDDIFYTSLTRPGGQNEDELWNVFAEGGRGVRLKLKVAPVRARSDLRPIQYEAPAQTLLNELNEALAKEGEPPFLPWTISRIGAFYLPSFLHREDEVRLMIKRYKDGRNDARPDAPDEYWPIPLNSESDYCRIDLVEIQLGPNTNRSDVVTAIKNTPLASTPIV
jgi:hypothetical protein